MGAYHTIDLQMNQKFTLAKPVWDVIALDRLGMRAIVSAALRYHVCTINILLLMIMSTSAAFTRSAKPVSKAV